MRSFNAIHFFIGAVFVTIIPIVVLYIRLTRDVNDYAAQTAGVPINIKRALPARFSYLAEHDCFTFPPDINNTYPSCYAKISWMFEHWQSHVCYAENGVDGSICTIRSYLSSKEDYCPPLPDSDVQEKYATKEERLFELFANFTDTPHNYKFIKERISRLWPEWSQGYDSSSTKYPQLYAKRKRKNILIHMGFLMTDKHLKFGEKSVKGGPLGELVQWSDLIASLFMLGHKLYISTEKETLDRNIGLFLSQPPCPNSLGKLDLMITDIIGLRSFQNRYKTFLQDNLCKIRLMDSFGTHIEYNFKSYFNQHRKEFGGSSKNPWGGNGLLLKQYWTFFPHTPDNTFLGFVVETRDVKPLFDRKSRDSVLIYGKEKYMWKGLDSAIIVLKELTEVHATVADLTNLQLNETLMFENVVNHGFLFTDELHALLKSVKIFVGIGFPIEGPAPFEAMANGAVFINAKFSPPKSRRNTPFLSEKPTSRQWTSQCPYCELIGPPYSYTVDINNEKELRTVIRQALDNEVPPKVPIEFTPEGMLLRVNLLVSRENLCFESTQYFPPEALQIYVGDNGLSCEEVCQLNNLVCEPFFFPLVNKESVLRSLNNCDKIEGILPSVYAPYDCIQQKSSQLFSCASKSEKMEQIRRICPCRDFLPEQSSICKLCV